MTTTAELAPKPDTGQRDDVGMWLAERLENRYAYEAQGKGGTWYWRLASGRLHPVDHSLVAQAVNGELAHIYYRLIDDTTFTAAQIDRLLSPSYVEKCLMPVLRMLLALPGSQPRPVRAKASKQPKEPKPRKRREFSEAAQANIRAAAVRTCARRRSCDECGLVSTPPGMGKHHKFTGHEGWTELEPA